jgi:hypothetical protein
MLKKTILKECECVTFNITWRDTLFLNVRIIKEAFNECSLECHIGSTTAASVGFFWYGNNVSEFPHGWYGLDL